MAGMDRADVMLPGMSAGCPPCSEWRAYSGAIMLDGDDLVGFDVITCDTGPSTAAVEAPHVESTLFPKSGVAGLFGCTTLKHVTLHS